MKKGIVTVMLLCCLLITACGNNETKMVCKMNSESNMKTEVVAILDSDEKVKEIEIHTIFEDEAAVDEVYGSFQTFHGSNLEREKNVLIIKNAHNPDTFAGQQYSKAVGLTKDEFQSFLGNYTCE